MFTDFSDVNIICDAEYVCNHTGTPTIVCDIGLEDVSAYICHTIKLIYMRHSSDLTSERKGATIRILEWGPEVFGSK